jgi:hypothetical protein
MPRCLNRRPLWGQPVAHGVSRLFIQFLRLACTLSTGQEFIFCEWNTITNRHTSYKYNQMTS